jgi:sialidase-1
MSDRRIMRSSFPDRRATVTGLAALAVAAAGTVAGSAVASLPSAAAVDGAASAAHCTASVPFVGNTEGYAAFRIPAVVRAADGTVLAFAEGRRGGLSDAGDIDTVLRRSTDGGCTWGGLQVVHDAGTDTAGNPVPIVTGKGRVVLLTTYNAASATETAILRGEVTAEQSRRVFVQYSDDQGATWSTPREITSDVKPSNWRWYATGPGHGIRLENGAHRGRLVVAANHSIAPPAGSTDLGSEAKYYGGHDLYSDDDGQTWHVGYVDDNPDGYLNVNESTAAELPDGRVYVNARDQNGTSPGNRADAYSVDGGATLQKPFRPQDTLVTPVVEGSVLQLRGPNAPLVYSGPSDPSNRAAMALRISGDQGATWTQALALSGLPAGYNDLVQLDANTVGVLYETGDFSATENLTLRRVAVSDLRK